MRAVITAALLTLVACAGEARGEAVRPAASPPAPVAEEPAPAPLPSTQGAPLRAVAAAAPSFDEPFPEEACPDAFAVRLAHSQYTLPSALTVAHAFRDEDGRHVRIALSDSPIALDDAGRFAPPGPSGARFEMDAVRTRRRPLEAGVLGQNDHSRAALTHVRVVTSERVLTFGHRAIGRVELTRVDDEAVCGRIELDDGFTRVRGPFRADVAGPLPL
ncbi:MAG: hypothetical protein AB7S26_28275 [Sandaracinaceae bacterium]